MGPYGVDRTVDQVKRLEAFRGRCPRVLITSPRQNGTLCWRAQWTEPSADDEGAVMQAEHSELRALLDHLERNFGRPS